MGALPDERGFWVCNTVFMLDDFTRDKGRRLALHAFYCRYDKPQQQYQRRPLRPETMDRLSPAARALLALDDPLNDSLSAQGEGRSGFLR